MKIYHIYIIGKIPPFEIQNSKSKVSKFPASNMQKVDTLYKASITTPTRSKSEKIKQYAQLVGISPRCNGISNPVLNNSQRHTYIASKSP